MPSLLLAIALLTNEIDPLAHLGSLTDQLRSPARIAVAADGTVLVTDPFKNHVARFDSSDNFLGTWPVPEGPIGVAAHPDGRFFVSLRDEAAVGIYIDDAGVFTRIGDLDGNGSPLVTFVRPTDIDIDPGTGRIYVVDAEADEVYGFESDGTLALKFGIRGEGNGQFMYPSAIAFDAANTRLIVADHDNFRAQIFDTGGVFLQRFGFRMMYLPGGEQEGWMPRTQGLAVDAAGLIYMTDAFMSTVRIYAPDTAHLGKVVEYGFDPGDLRTPCDLALSPDGLRLYVVSTNTSSVEIYEAPTGGKATSGGPGGMSDPPGTNWCGFDTPRPAKPKPRELSGVRKSVPGIGGPIRPTEHPGNSDWVFMRRSDYEGPHMIDATIICGRCHGITGQPGGHVGLLEGQSVLCMSCHSAGGQGLTMPIHERDLADPFGTNPNVADGLGSSHAWGVPAVSTPADSIGPLPDGEMERYLDADGKIKCATCHNQHSNDAGAPYLRVSNVHGAMCKQCHAPRNEGPGELGTHAVGFDYPGGTGEFPAEGEIAPLLLEDGEVECLTCHGVHYADSGGANDGEGDGMLLRAANDETLCQTCHSGHVIHDVGGAWQPKCGDCHDVHDPESENLSLVGREVNGTPVTFEDNDLGGNGLHDFIHSNHDPASYDGMCEVCHTSTSYHRNDASGDHAHYADALCTDCHPHNEGFMPSGGACDTCHGQPPDGDTFPNTAGSHATHMGGVSGPEITDCYVCHAPIGDTHNNGLPSFASGTDANGNGNIELDETDACDTCHSPDGPYDGVAEGKANWAAGASVSCEGCHDTGTSTIQGVSAPPVAGDGINWGYFASGHGRSGYVACTTCHDAAAPHADGLARTYGFDSGYYDPEQSGLAYAAGYRLRDVAGEVPLMIPANYGITFDYNAQTMKENAFRLCFNCHDPSMVLDDTPGDGIDSNFKASLPSPPRDYSYAWGSGADINEHVSHLMNYIGPFADSDWDTSTVGPGGQDGRDTMTACSSCHNVHGAAGDCGSTNETMIRDGTLAGRPGGYGFTYVLEDVGAGGYPMVTSTGATNSTSVGAIFRYNTAVNNMCGGSMCHGDPAPPADCSYDASGSSWGTYLEYYRPWEDHAGQGACLGCHAQAQDNGDGVPTGGRRAVVGEFPVDDAHAHYGAELDDDACTVCHDMATHMDGEVDLFDADTGTLYTFVTPDQLASDPDVSDFCTSCHDADGATRLATPLDPFGNGNAASDVAGKFQGTLQWSEWYGDGCYGEEGTERAVNSHHDISDADQAFSGAKIECLHCHSAHGSGASQPLVDPDDGLAPWSSSENEFCLTCHDGGNGPNDPGFPVLPLEVIGPTIPMRGLDSCDYVEEPWYVDYTWTHSAHGLDSKRGWNGYSGAPSYELLCTDCHDPHGSYTATNTMGNPYMIRDFVDGTMYVDDGVRPGHQWTGPPWDTYGIARDVVVTIDDITVDWGSSSSLCSVCHATWLNAYGWHDFCTGCQTCHGHGQAWGEADLVGYDDDTPCPIPPPAPGLPGAGGDGDNDAGDGPPKLPHRIQGAFPRAGE